MSYASFAHRTFCNMLGTLAHLVTKAQDAGLAEDMLGARLTEDMFPLELQFRVALNQVLLGLNQTAGRTLPLEEKTYLTLADVGARIAAVRVELDRADAGGWSDADTIVDLTLPNGIRYVMSAEADLRDWILPNFYFHVTMAYALLRHAGVTLGKIDFLPHMARHEVASA